MGEIRIRRDERNRVTGLDLRDVAIDTAVGRSALHLVRTVTASLIEYLHVNVESVDGETGAEVTIDRCDTHLDRELDAVLETLVIGLRLLEKECEADLVLEELTVGVEV